MKMPGGGRRRYSFYSFMNLALDGGEWSAPWPAVINKYNLIQNSILYIINLLTVHINP
jgi:hypothetical protein